MKKTILIFSLLAILTFFSACGKTDTLNPGNQSPSQTEQNQKTDKPTYYGEWMVKGVAAYGRVSSIGNEDIKKLIGKKITLSDKTADFELNLSDAVTDSEHFSISSPVYKEFAVSAEDFFNSWYISFENLGIQSDKITRIDVLSKDSDESKYSFYIKDQDTLLINRGGVCFELIKSNLSGAAETASVASVSELIPTGWHILESAQGASAKAEGDLNKDGINDIAIVIENDVKPEEGAPLRGLLIAFGNKDGTYSLSIRADKAVLRADEGGAFGDPFEGISIDKGSVILNFYGGSNWRWYSKYRFRYQDNDWYLIGATLGSYFTGTTTIENADEEDYNLLTGDFIIKKADENGKMQTIKGNRGKKELLKLKEFDAGAGSEQFLK